MKLKVFSAVVFVVALLGLFVGLGWLINLRFESGDAYPVGSTMRSDPMGTKALYASYEKLPSLAVNRSYVPLDQVEELPSDVALLLLHTSAWGVHGIADFEVIDQFVKDGGRLVIALDPKQIGYQYIDEEEELDDEDGIEESEAEEREGYGFVRRPDEDQEAFWAGMSLAHGEHEGGEARLTNDAAVTRLPNRVPWREGGVLIDYDEEQWTALYEVDEEVVAAERAYGKGSLMVLTDSYLFSNEALLKHRYPELLAWVVGAQRRVVFDETHLGVSERTGISMLMRRYRLYGFVSAFGCLMALVIWRGASPLLPSFEGRARSNVVLTEHSTEAGLGDLIRRSVTLGELPELGFKLWKESFIRSKTDRSFYAAELEEAEALFAEERKLSSRKRRPRELHSKIQTLINRKKRRRL